MRIRYRSGVNVTLACVAVALIVRVATARQVNVNTLCAENAATLARGIAGYTQDWDEKMPPMKSGIEFRRAVTPYVGSPWLWRFYCPATHLAYTLNVTLDRRPLAAITGDPGDVWTFKDPKPHRDGKSTVGFLDGHAERGGVDVVEPNALCLWRARQLAVGVLMYAQDYDSILPPMHTPDEFQSAVLPYVKTRRMFVCPDTRLPYVPNALLSGTLVTAYPNPSLVEVLRDPAPHRDGKTTIGFLDGSAIRK